jgi:regulator of PEP synthase PpsR (kinase-PPPase family)
MENMNAFPIRRETIFPKKLIQNGKNTPPIYVVSDGTGESAKRIVKSALTQFKSKPLIEVKPKVITIKEAKEIVKLAKLNGAPIFFTLVKSDIRAVMKNETLKRGVLSVDLLESSLEILHKVLKSAPSETPGLFLEFEKERIRRSLSAIEFTLEHDDGKDPKGYKDADIVLVGVSRASKSSTAFYLGYCGVKTANVPIHYSTSIPPELLQIDRKKIVALIITPSRLESVRNIRAKKLKFDINDPYTNRHEIAKEIRHINDLINKYKWETVEVSYQAIEEIAWEVGQRVGLNVSIFPS